MIVRRKLIVILACIVLAGLLTSCKRNEVTGVSQTPLNTDCSIEKDLRIPTTSIPEAEPTNTPTLKSVSGSTPPTINPNTKKSVKQTSIPEAVSTKILIKKKELKKKELKKKSSPSSNKNVNETTIAAAPNVTQAPESNKIQEDPSPTATPIPKQVFTGFIIDKDCVEEPGPEKDTIDCLLMDSCRDSGYGLAVKIGNEYVWYEFDNDGKEKAYEILKLTTKYQQISVKIEGVLNNNILQVSDMNEN